MIVTGAIGTLLKNADRFINLINKRHGNWMLEQTKIQ